MGTLPCEIIYKIIDNIKLSVCPIQERLNYFCVCELWKNICLEKFASYNAILFSIKENNMSLFDNLTLYVKLDKVQIRNAIKLAFKLNQTSAENIIFKLLDNNYTLSRYDSRYLILACKYGHTKLVNYLIKSKKISLISQNCRALIESAKNGQLEIFKILLSQLSNFLSNKCSILTIAFEKAVRNGKVDIAKLLFNRYILKILSEIVIKRYIIRAATLGYKEVLEFLLNDYLDNKISSYMDVIQYSLFLACNYGHDHIVKLLTRCDFTIDYSSLDITPKIFQCLNDNNVFNMLSKNKNPNINVNRSTYLHMNNSVKKMIGVSPKKSPLIYACKKGHVGVVKILLSHPHIIIADCLKEACTYQNKDIILTLLSHEKITGRQIFEALILTIINVIRRNKWWHNSSKKHTDAENLINRKIEIFNCLISDKTINNTDNETPKGDTGYKDMIIYLFEIMESVTGSGSQLDKYTSYLLFKLLETFSSQKDIFGPNFVSKCFIGDYNYIDFKLFSSVIDKYNITSDSRYNYVYQIIFENLIRCQKLDLVKYLLSKECIDKLLNVPESIIKTKDILNNDESQYTYSYILQLAPIFNKHQYYQLMEILIKDLDNHGDYINMVNDQEFIVSRFNGNYISNVVKLLKKLLHYGNVNNLSLDDLTYHKIVLALIKINDSESTLYIINKFNLNPRYRNNELLISSVKYNRVEIVKRLLQDKRVNPTDRYYKSLRISHKNGNTEIYKILLDHIMNINPNFIPCKVYHQSCVSVEAFELPVAW